MLFLNHSYLTAESNLALDETLLEYADSGLGGQILRIWESPVYFVVLGYSSKWKKETHHFACQNDNISILRRKSGGATVLQGPGCLNFSLILESKESSGISSDTKQIMLEHQKAASTWGLSGEIQLHGVSDLTWQGRKFSGNAMRRGKKYFLFHGTFLYGFDLKKISTYLDSPEREPAYRAKRNHLDFLTNVPIDKNRIINSLRQTWGAKAELKNIPDIEKVQSEFYSNKEWNLKF